MTATPDLLALYEAKALAELGDADALAGVAAGGWSGDPLGAVALVVAGRSAGEDEADELVAGEVREAAGKALAALGFEEGSAFVIASRPAGADSAGLIARLRLALEAVDAPLALALDPRAADDLAAAFGLPHLEPGKPVRAAGRILGSVGDFGGSLGDAKAKARVWAAMRSVAAVAGHRTQARRPAAPREGTVSR
jgi:hypothetical protein